MLIQVSLRAVHELKFAKKAVTLTSQKSPLRVSLSLSHTHFGLSQGFDVNANFPTNIFFTFIWKSSRYLPTTSAYELGRFWRPPCSSHRGPKRNIRNKDRRVIGLEIANIVYHLFKRMGSRTYKIVKSFLISLSLVPL